MPTKPYILLFIFTIISIALSCEKKATTENNLYPENVYPLDIEELSGLTSAGGGILYTVSDNTNRVYKITDKGRILSTLNYQGNDLEGVAINKNTNIIYVVEERSREIVELDFQGNVNNRAIVKVENFDANSGLEGISVNPMNNNIFVVNEKSPTKLIELNENKVELYSGTPGITADFSGICINPESNELWILSDEAQKICRCDMKGNRLTEYSISIFKAEGLAIDFDRKQLFIVSDMYKKLYVFQLPM